MWSGIKLISFVVAVVALLVARSLHHALSLLSLCEDIYL